MRFHRLTVFLAFGFPSARAADDFKLSDQKAVVSSPAVSEASGLAVSSRDDRFLWAINDSGGTPELHLIGTDGADRGKVKITNAKNNDWEDIASFKLDGKPWLIVADTGDNKAKRESCTLHLIPEPKLPADGGKLDGNVAAAYHIDFTFEGGPRDCESVAVDTAGGKIILISKRTIPPEVYELPLGEPKKKGVLVAKKLGQTEVKAPVSLPFADQPVSLDISEDRSFAAVVTYYGVFLFTRKPDETWADALSHKPLPLDPHGIGQAESVAISKDGKSIYVVAEGKNPPIRVYQR